MHARVSSIGLTSVPSIIYSATLISYLAYFFDCVQDTCVKQHFMLVLTVFGDSKVRSGGCITLKVYRLTVSMVLLLQDNYQYTSIYKITQIVRLIGQEECLHDSM